MSEKTAWRISQLARKFNVSAHRLAEYLRQQGYQVDGSPNAKIDAVQYQVVEQEFSDSALKKREADDIVIAPSLNQEQVIFSGTTKERKVGSKREEEIVIKNLGVESPAEETRHKKELKTKVVGRIDLKPKRKEEKKESRQPKASSSSPSAPKEVIRSQVEQIKGLTVKGQIALPKEKTEDKESSAAVQADSESKTAYKKRPRRRIVSYQSSGQGGKGADEGHTRTESKDKKEGAKKYGKGDKKPFRRGKEGPRAYGGSKAGSSASRTKYRREKRLSAQEKARVKHQGETKQVLEIAEFSSISDMSSLMEVPVNELISKCMEMGMLVSINQRLDSEAITVLADEYGYEVSFTSESDDLSDKIESENLPDTEKRAPIVTIMGHVDHGKTSLLDFVRNTNVTDTEAGGITQHIGAYEVQTKKNRRIVFLDTPGHAAFTAMRARGAQVTDVAIIVIAADDHVRPQTEEAISHVKIANVPFIVALNKTDKPEAQPDVIREELSKQNVLVEEWGGKYQCQEISAKKGTGIDELLDKVLVEADLLELKANPQRRGVGTVIEASLDKGRGFIATVLVQDGELSLGHVLLAGAHYGKVKAMFNHMGQAVEKAIPATPVQILGLNGAPQSGEKFYVLPSEKEARELAGRREQITREQRIRAQKHVTLDDLSKRMQMASFKELNLVIKGDVDGSVEALSDALLKLSTDEIQVNIIHKAVGGVSESDVLLASASDAIVIGFQVRPSASTRRLAEKEEIEIRLYSIIFEAIDDIKQAIEGMLGPKIEKVVIGTAEVKQLFKVSKLGAIAGCQVMDGVVRAKHQIKLVRESVVVYEGEIQHLKHFKEEVQEVKAGQECGINIKDYNDIKVGDTIEVLEQRETKRTLSPSSKAASS